MTQVNGNTPSAGSTPPAPTPAPLPVRQPGATFQKPPATVGKPKPAPSRPTAYGAPSLGAHLDRVGGAQ